MNPVTRKWLDQSAVTAVALFLCCAAGFGILLYQKVPVFTFTAVCRNYDNFSIRAQENGDLEQVEEPYTQEFLDLIAEDLREFSISYDNSVSVVGTRVHIGLDYHYDIGTNDAHFDHEIGTWRYFQSEPLVHRIYNRRIAEGRFDDTVRARYQARNRRGNVIQDMDPGECGMMEDLIRVGGPLSSEP